MQFCWQGEHDEFFLHVPTAIALECLASVTSGIVFSTSVTCCRWRQTLRADTCVVEPARAQGLRGSPGMCVYVGGGGELHVAAGNRRIPRTPGNTNVQIGRTHLSSINGNHMKGRRSFLLPLKNAICARGSHVTLHRRHRAIYQITTSARWKDGPQRST